MSQIAHQAAPITGNLDIILNVSSNTKAIEISNQSPNLLLVSLAGSFGQFYMSPYTDRYKNVPNYNNGNINVAIVATMIGSGQAPLNQFSVATYGPEDPDQNDFVISTGLLNSSGNLNSLSSTSSVVNDGNAPGTQVIESTELSSTGNNLLFTNGGFVQIAEYVSSVFTLLLQVLPGSSTAIKLGALARAVEVLGTLQVDQAATITGTLTATNAANFVLATQLQDVANLPGFRLGGFSAGDTIDNSGANFIAKSGPGGAFVFNDQNGNKWQRSAETHGSVSIAAGNDAVVNHGITINGVNTAPDEVVTSTANTVNTNGYANVFNITTTQFSVHNGAGAAQIIRWHATKF